MRSAALALLFLGAAAGRGEAGPARRTDHLFPSEAPVYAEGPRLSRLDLPPSVLRACRPDLSDLRVFDPAGQEVPYLVLGGEVDNNRTRVVQRVPADLLDVERRAEQRRGVPDLFRETYELAAPTVPSQTGSWDLVLGARTPEFAARIRVEAPGARPGSPAVLGQGSVFRLPDPLREKLTLRLRPFAADRVRVTLESEGGGYLEPAFRFESARVLPDDEERLAELRVLRRESPGGKTVLELDRPRGLPLTGLRVETTTGSFQRSVTVWDEGPGAPPVSCGPAARGTVFRIQTHTTAEESEVWLPPLQGNRLRVVIDDGDSPALEGLRVRGRVRPSALILTLPGSGPGTPAGTLRFGGGRAHAPRYDLAALGQALAVPSQGHIAVALRDPALLGKAWLGPILPNPASDPSPALAFALHPGAPVDSRAYSHRRLLEVRASPDGLVRYPLAPEDLARLRPDRADLRIADGQSRQWAYLLEAGTPQSRPLAVVGPTVRKGRSRYGLGLPASLATLDWIALYTPAAFFDRAFDLAAVDAEGRKRVLASGRLSRRAGCASPVEIAFPPARVASLELAVDDGSDAPLAFSRADGRFAAPELYFAAPAGRYSLLLGNPDDPGPSYELAKTRELVLAVRSEAAGAGALEENPAFRRAARLAGDAGWQTAILWAVLSLATAALLWFTLRLVRREGDAGGATQGARGEP